MKRRTVDSRLSRRQALMGLGGIALSLPWLEKLNGTAGAQATSSGPKRVIVVSYAMGVPLGQWRPNGAGSAFTLPYVTAPLDAFKDRCLFVSAIDNSVLDVGGDPFVYGHPGKKESALTGTLTSGAFPTNNTNQLSELLGQMSTAGGANGPSVEHVIGQALKKKHPLSSVDLAVHGESHLYGVNPTVTSEFFFEGRDNPVTMTSRPDTALSKVFAGVTPSGSEPTEADLAYRALRERNKSVLDAVRSSFKDLRQGLSREDQRRLDDHAALIRQLELEVGVSASCTVPSDIAAGNLKGASMGQVAQPMIKLLTHAMACELAPVGRLEFVAQDAPSFGIASVDSLLSEVSSADYNWHALVHGDPLPGTSGTIRPGRGEGQTYDSRLLDGYRFFVQQFADLLSALDSVPEGPETSVLDNSLVVLASDLGEGLGHAHHKMGYILAGNLGAAKKGFHLDAGPKRTFEVGGQYFYAPSTYNVSQLLNSMLDMAGVVDAQGKPANMGLGGYLQSRGLNRRIDALFG